MNSRPLILVIILVITAGAYFAFGTGVRGPGPVKLPDEAHGRISIQYLMARMCSACQEMEPVLSQVKDTYKEQVFIHKIDVQARPGTIRAYGIRVVPALVFYGPDGTVFYRYEGSMTMDKISEVLEKAASFPEITGQDGSGQTTLPSPED
ncbi:thioredoxin family protein [Desulfonatronovibrio hydrogenovorans]|uniref:thioredoxin family protein n=1 Tax=Desulfonatronovibrio hydrogenovorans TaxID=53245 RepID=UPI0004907EBD|nr:thioredoxin family protein [Desulfonatronovibrio hydrogenovorans]